MEDDNNGDNEEKIITSTATTTMVTTNGIITTKESTVDSSFLGGAAGTPPTSIRKVKPVLKAQVDYPPSSKTINDTIRKKKKKKKGLQWDEEVIAEHDQLRGTRMKVRFIIIKKGPRYYSSVELKIA